MDRLHVEIAQVALIVILKLVISGLTYVILIDLSTVNLQFLAFLVAQMIKNPPIMQETWVQSLSWEDPLEKNMATHSIFLPGEFHGQRCLAGYSPGVTKSQT